MIEKLKNDARDRLKPLRGFNRILAADDADDVYIAAMIKRAVRGSKRTGKPVPVLFEAILAAEIENRKAEQERWMRRVAESARLNAERPRARGSAALLAASILCATSMPIAYPSR